MQRHLESRLGLLRSRVRRLLALHGMSLVIASVVPAILVACLSDWFVHLVPEVRVAALIAVIGLGATLAVRHVVRPLVVRFRDLDIALRIEERWPGLNDRLASTVQFLRESDTAPGSAALRQATINQTLKETETIDFGEVIDPSPARKAMLAGLGALGIAGIFVVAEPELSRIGLVRFFAPYSSARWPQQTHLTLTEAPKRVARGEAFNLAVAIASGERMPSSAKVTYKFADGEKVVESLRPVEGGTFRGRIETVTRPFEFMVAAGDDSTSWFDVAVVPPPVLEELIVKITPPVYTGLEPSTLAPGNTQVKAVVGSRIELTGRANKPLNKVTMFQGDKAEESVATLVPGNTSRIAAAFDVTTTQAFYLALVDTEGFKSQEATRYDVRAQKDEAPRVTITQPSNDRDVPAIATVPIKIMLDDDFGLHNARIVYKISVGNSEPSQEVVMNLWEGPTREEGGPVTHHEISFNWDLAPLGLEPNSIIYYYADARDYLDPNGPNLGKSRELRLRIISDDDAKQQLDEQQRAIRDEAQRINEMQKQARRPVEEAIRTLDRTNEIAPKDREQLANAEMIQRQVSGRITSKSDGLEEKIQRLGDDLKNFKINDKETEEQLASMQQAIDRIKEQSLANAEQNLTRANKGLGDQAKDAAKQNSDPAKAQTPTDQNPGKPGDPKPSSPEAGKPVERAKEALGQADKNQKAIADELQKMLDSLSRFDTQTQVVRDIQQAIKSQEQVMKETAAAGEQKDSQGKELQGKELKDLTNEQKAALENLGGRQNEVARALQAIQEKMKEMAGRMESEDPLAAGALKGAAEESKDKNTAGKMGEAADQLAKNQVGNAQKNQDQAKQELKDLLDQVQNRRDKELERLVKELKEAEKELDKLKARQTENLKKTKEAKAIPDKQKRTEELQKLGKEQKKIEAEAKKQLQKLKKLRADSAAAAGEKAAAKMAKAGQELDDDQGEQGEQAEKDQEEALKDLEEAKEELEQTRKEAEEQLANEQIAKMGDSLKSLSERQQKLVDEIKGYEKSRTDAGGKLTDAQRAGVLDLSRVERAMKDETDELTEKLDGAPIFSLILKRVAATMDDATKRLQARKTDEDTQRIAQSSADRFKQLVASLKPDPPKNGGQQQGDSPPGGDQPGGGSQGDGIPAAAQLRMLRTLQQEINDRTEFFDELKRRNKAFTPEQDDEIAKLQTDQGTLADLVRDMSKPKKSDAEQ